MVERIIYNFRTTLEESIDDLEERQLNSLRRRDKDYIAERLRELRNLLVEETKDDHLTILTEKPSPKLT